MGESEIIKYYLAYIKILTVKMASDQLRCPLCSKWLCTERQPRLLNCGHSFCIECLHQCPVFDDYSVQLNHQTQNRGDEIAADKTAGDTTTSRSSTTTTTEQKSL
jgi:hypothetical protein